MQSGLVETTDHGGAPPSRTDSETDSGTDGPVVIFRSQEGHELRVTALDLLLVATALSLLGVGATAGSAVLEAARGG